MENIGIETSQNVDINYRIASIGDRIVAQILDFLILGGYVFATIILWTYVIDTFSNSEFYFPVAMMVILYLPMFLYDFICELFLNGQSLGKKIMKIKVVKVDGSQPGIGSYFLRWILKPIDVFFTQGAVALLTILINGKGQRLGDLAANTTVIKLKQDIRLEEIVIKQEPTNYEVKFAQVSMLSEKDIQIIKDVFYHLRNADPNSYSTLLEKAKIGISNKMGVQTEMEAIVFLDTVIKDYNFINSK